MLHSNLIHLDAQVLTGRLLELWERTGDRALYRLAEGRPPHAEASFVSEQERADWISTSLMDCYKNTGDPAVFALLFELNRAAFLHAIHCNLRRVHHQIDEQDVLQEVFLNIYRYPHRFMADKADAFRGWGHRIARNTLLKFLKGHSRLARFREIDEEVLQPEDLRTRRPDRAASEAESARVVNHAYVLYLQLYLLHFRRLSAKERLALTMVEIDGVSYRDAAAALRIRLENLKMVIFRGRRKIFRGMERSLGDLALGDLALSDRALSDRALGARAHGDSARVRVPAAPKASAGGGLRGAAGGGAILPHSLRTETTCRVLMQSTDRPTCIRDHETADG